MDNVPTAFFPFLFAVLAAIGGYMFRHRQVSDEPNALVSNILYAVALGCVIIGIWVMVSSS